VGCFVVKIFTLKLGGYVEEFNLVKTVALVSAICAAVLMLFIVSRVNASDSSKIVSDPLYSYVLFFAVLGGLSLVSSLVFPDKKEEVVEAKVETKVDNNVVSK
jgi:hypothetical protein